MHKRTLDISTCILLITHDRQRRTEKKKKKKKSTVLHYPRSTPKCNYMYPQYWNIPLGFLAGETSVPTAGATEHVTIPRHMRAYIYRWCVCALNARQYATLPRLTPTERHVVMYDVWVFPAHPSLCAALPDLTSAVLSNFVTAAVPNGR